VEVARTQVMDVLDKNDGAREELAEALKAEPRTSRASASPWSISCRADHEDNSEKRPGRY
jgi:hypothetical protein